MWRTADQLISWSIVCYNLLLMKISVYVSARKNEYFKISIEVTDLAICTYMHLLTIV